MAQAEINVTAMVLAAGLSSRMGDINKLLAPINGTALIRRVIDQVQQSQAHQLKIGQLKAGPIIVVTGHQAHLIGEALAGCDVLFVENKNFAEGLSTSLRTGLKAVPETAAGALICLGDMPKLTARHIDDLIRAFREHQGDKICVPIYQGRQGNPVLWPRKYFAEMQELRGDVGAKKLIEQHRDHVHEVVMNDEGVVRDIDTPEDLAKI